MSNCQTSSGRQYTCISIYQSTSTSTSKCDLNGGSLTLAPAQKKKKKKPSTTYILQVHLSIDLIGLSQTVNVQ